MPETLKPLNRVILIEPKNGIYTGFQGLVRTEPLGLECVAGAISPFDPNLPRTVENVLIHDDRLQPGGWREKMRQNPPDIIGVRCSYTADVPIVHQLIKEIREEVGKEIPIIVGGHHISLRPSDAFIDGVNAVVIGPGEEPMKELTEAWGKKRSFKDIRNIWYRDGAGKWQSNVSPRQISSSLEFNSCGMDNRPLPRRDLVAEYRKMGDGYFFLYYPNVAAVESSRGCRFRCSFCSVYNFHQGKYAVESPSRTVNEIRALPDDIKYVILVDDLAFNSAVYKNPLTGRRELYDPGMKLAEELKRLGLEDRIRFWAQVRTDDVYPKDPADRKRAEEKFDKLAGVGLDMTLNGLESLSSPGELKRVNKGNSVEANIRGIEILHKKGIRVWGAQIVFPGWTEEDYMLAIKTNNKLSIEAPQFTILTPLPGSSDYEKALSRGELTTLNPAHYDFFHWVIQTKLRPEETYKLIARLYQETGSSLNSLEGIKADIKTGRTTLDALRAFQERFAKMQDAQTHLSNIRQADSTQEAWWRDFLREQASRYGGSEIVLLNNS